MTEHEEVPIPKCQACQDHERTRNAMKSEPPEWFTKSMVALIAFIIVVVTLAIVL